MGYLDETCPVCHGKGIHSADCASCESCGALPGHQKDVLASWPRSYRRWKNGMGMSIRMKEWEPEKP